MISFDFLDTPVEYAKGVGPKRAEALKKEFQIFTFEDLLNHFPFRYIDRSKFYKISEITEDMPYVQLKGRIILVQLIGKPGSQRLSAILRDQTGDIELIWFQGIRWAKEKLKPDAEYIVFGRPSYFGRQVTMPHPEVEGITESLESKDERFQPIYSSTEKLKSLGMETRGIRNIMQNLVSTINGKIPEVLTSGIITDLRLMGRQEAYHQIHFPADLDAIWKAQTRLKFEELFFLQLKLLNLKYLRLRKSKGHVFRKVGEYLNTFYKEFLPFELTGAQKRVIKEIRVDAGSGRQMNRLLQGDVGSGKTLVALMSMLIALDNGFQACLMAPTEILAQQHYQTFAKFLQGMGISVELLTGSAKSAKRKKIQSELLSGELRILIGTHALIEESVKFKNLGLVVIDEQHRFGVMQRAKLWEKNEIPPHVLVMTATPIPRTLAMTLYGDLDVSVIDELPPGRKAVKTFHFTDSDRLRVFGSMRKQIGEGRQIYIVYPMINESDKTEMKYLMDGYESICREFPLPEYAVSMVHGQMKPGVKDYEMERFIKGETQIMVATTVIEVGVDVPNASVMIIENAERFGLSQLHQLRGRVGRGADQSFCILMSGNKLSNDARERIETMLKSTDGFEIAEVDLKLRGPGDLHGTMQSGILDLRLADIIKDEKMLKYARNLANEILSKDPSLESPDHAVLARYLRRLERVNINLGQIS